MVFDTGSSNTWILNKNVFNNSEPAYDETKSTTVQKSDQEAFIQFGSGSLSGHFFNDIFQIGEGDHSIKIENQRFGNVEK